jgi:O-antigen/teichoic acid export membrane protein
LAELFGTTLALRLLLFILGALGMAVYVLLIGYNAQTVVVIWIIGACFLIGQVTSTCSAALKGLERMEFTSLGSIIFTSLLTFPRIGMLLLGYGVIPIAAIGILANLASLGIEYFFLQKLTSFKLSVNWHLIRSVLTASLPYFLVTIGIVIYHQVDIVIISLLVNEQTIGWYAAADRLFGTLLFIPNVLGTALFPALTRAYADSQTASHELARKSMNLLFLVSAPIGLGMMAIADQVVVLLFGAEFANSGPVLAVRGMILILTYANMLLGFLLITMDRQKIWAVVLLLATLATIPLDLILVPWTVKTFANGALGGALSYTFTEIGMTAAGLALLPKGTFNRANAKVIAKVLLAALVMAGASWTVRGGFIVIPIAIGAATYFGMVFILHALPKEDWEYFIGIGSSLFQRVRGRFSKTVDLKG